MVTCKELLGGLESNVETSLMFKNQPEHWLFSLIFCLALPEKSKIEEVCQSSAYH